MTQTSWQMVKVRSPKTRLGSVHQQISPYGRLLSLVSQVGQVLGGLEDQDGILSARQWLQTNLASNLTSIQAALI